VKLQIFDAEGRTIATLADEFMTSGRHELRWKGRDESGRPVASGVYFAQVRSSDQAQARRLVLVQ
jgi:flagellar hook assembly protein FlgD